MGFLWGDYYLRPEKMRLQKKYTICLEVHVGKLDTFFRQIRFRLAFVFGLQTYYLIDFSKIYQLKGLEPKNKG